MPPCLLRPSQCSLHGLAHACRKQQQPLQPPPVNQLTATRGFLLRQRMGLGLGRATLGPSTQAPNLEHRCSGRVLSETVGKTGLTREWLYNGRSTQAYSFHKADNTKSHTSQKNFHSVIPALSIKVFSSNSMQMYNIGPSKPLCDLVTCFNCTASDGSLKLVTNHA